jgi:hypothetical protein
MIRREVGSGLVWHQGNPSANVAADRGTAGHHEHGHRVTSQYQAGGRGCQDADGEQHRYHPGLVPRAETVGGAGYVPAVAAVWQQAFAHAQFVLLSPENSHRVAWTPALRAYFAANFVRLKSRWKYVTLYKRGDYNLAQPQWAG